MPHNIQATTHSGGSRGTMHHKVNYSKLVLALDRHHASAKSFHHVEVKSEK
jgi:hypothetical protein